ncbi:MAG: NADP-dependent oxidoreductase [Burkholderiales bacterium]
MSSTMLGWRIHNYGGVDSLRLETMPRPTPGAGELLVRLHAASLNPIDWKTREGMMKAYLPLELPRVLGRDGAGEVIAVGADVTGWKPGMRVLGVATVGRDGTHAEYCIFAATSAAQMPSGVSDDAAVCLGIAGLSAYIPLVELAKVVAGERVLVHAGAGGVGGLGIQIAKMLGAEVIATCGAANLDYVRSLGADRAIDYATEDFVAAAGPCDVVLDTMGGEVHQRSALALKPGGRLVYLAAVPVQPVARTDIKVEQARIVASPARLGALLQWAAERRIKPQVGKQFPLAQAPAAYQLSQAGHARGKIVLLG